MDAELDIMLLAALIAGEARGESYDGQVAVGCVVRNRVDTPSWWGRTWRAVMLHPRQFSTLNPPDNADGWKGRDALVTLLALVQPQHMHIARGIYYRWIPDNTNGATHYVNLRLVQPPWLDGVLSCAHIGQHTFYREFQRGVESAG